MKILYIAGDRHDAQLAAFALRRVAPDVAVAWTSSLVAARRWVEDNRNAAALIVEVDTDHSGLESFVDQVRGLGMSAPVIVAARNADAPVRSVERVNVQIIQKNDAYLNVLPSVVSRALGLAPAAADASTPTPAGETSAEAQAAGAEGDPAATQRLFGQAVQARDVLEQRLREALTAVEHATQARAADAAIITTLEQRLTETETVRHELEQRAAKLASLEQRLTEAETARRELEQRIAAIGSFEQPLAEAETARQELDQRAATIASLEQRLSGAEAARQELEQRVAAVVTLEQRLTEGESARQELEHRLAASAAAAPAPIVAAEPAPALVQSLADATLALEQAERRHAAEMRDVTARFFEQRKHGDERAAQATAALDALQARLVEEAAALQNAEHRAAADRQAAAEEATRRLAKIESDLAREVANRQTLETAVASADAARARAEQRHAAELTAAADRLSEHEHQAERRLSEAAAAAGSLEARLAELTAALQRAEAQHALEIRESATRLGDHRAQAEARLAQANSAIALLQSQLTDAAAALQRTEQEAAADRRRSAEQTAERQTTFETQLSQERAERDSIAARLHDIDTAYQQAVSRHSTEMAASAAELAEAQKRADEQLAAAVAAADAERQHAAGRQTAFEAEIAQLVIGRQTLEKALTERDTARQLADQRHSNELTEAAARLADYRQQSEAQLAQARTEAETALRDARAQAAAERDTAARERTEREAAFQSELTQEVTRREILEQEVADARAAVDQAQRRFLEGVTTMRERAREHELRLEESAGRERTQWEATLAEREERIGLLQSERDVARQTLAAREDHLQQLQELQRKERAESATLATRLAELQNQTIRKRTADDAAAHATARRFAETPAAMWRCRPDGTMTQATQHLATLLGYTSVDELRQVDLAATVFDSSEELQWLIGRCVASGKPESVDTTWAKRDGTRMVVRLSALAATTDEIDLIAEDITAVRTLEERLDHAQRLEAVARYAAEVAVTCETVLKDASQQGQQWLAKLDGDIARRQGEALLAEITRAAGFLRQLAAYGDKQKSAPALAEVTDVLKNLGPVLKRVAGENIELALPKGSAPLNLDVEVERVERILVNVAAYARGRMPHGGRLVIEVTTVQLDRAFAEKYPSVRPGAHVLFTVTEAKSAARADWSAAYLNPNQSGDGAASSTETPGVDLGVLQTLVSDSGGHLWMAAEPSGDMVLKIHLPRRALDERGTPKRSGRWFSRAVAARG